MPPDSSFSNTATIRDILRGTDGIFSRAPRLWLTAIDAALGSSGFPALEVRRRRSVSTHFREDP
jgi:hypothetical protein